MMTIFEETKGVFSMRRVLAFILCLVAVAIIVLCVVFKLEWKAICAAGGLPLAGSLVLLFFTTWDDVKTVVSAVKGDE